MFNFCVMDHVKAPCWTRFICLFVRRFIWFRICWLCLGEVQLVLWNKHYHEVNTFSHTSINVTSAQLELGAIWTEKPLNNPVGCARKLHFNTSSAHAPDKLSSLYNKFGVSAFFSIQKWFAHFFIHKVFCHQVSISSTFYLHIFHAKVLCAAFL